VLSQDTLGLIDTPKVLSCLNCTGDNEQHEGNCDEVDELDQRCESSIDLLVFARTVLYFSNFDWILLAISLAVLVSFRVDEEYGS